jgi:DNA-binding FadR family transcriptional regulator
MGANYPGTVAPMPPDEALTAIFEPVAPSTTFEETVERLGTAIRLGLLAPGTRLPSERELAEQLAISRSTLRQALTTLVQSGHLTSQRGRGGGTFVAEVPPLAAGPSGPLPDDVRQTLDLRLALEIGAVTLAAEHGGGDQLDLLRECVARMDAADEFDDYRRADIRFHIALAQATGAPRLVALMTEVQAEMSELIAYIAHPEEVLTHSNAEHQRLVDAVEQGDVDGAVRTLRGHLEGTAHILAGLMPGGG